MNIVFMSMDTLPSTLWARDLYDQMHIRSDFRKWFPRMCQYGFIEGRDYEYMPRVRLQDEGGRTVQRYVKDYRITQDMAKKLCKLHHTAVGAAYHPQPFDWDALLGLLHTTLGMDVIVSNLVNTMYCRDAGKKLRTANQVKWRKGITTASAAPFGYQFDPDKKGAFIVDPPAAKIVRRIFDLAILGLGTREIAMMLNDENVPVPSVYNKENKAYGKETTYTIAPVILWDSSRVWKILTAYVYTGAMVLGKTKTLISGKSIVRTVPKGQQFITEGTHEAIVSREEFEKAQLVIKSNSHKVLMGGVDFPLKGKVRCGNCRRVMAHNFKQAVPTFWCREGLELVGQTQCTSEVFQVSDIENAVFQALKKELSLLDVLYGDIQKEEQGLKEAHKKASRRKTLMEQELKNLKGEKMRMYEEYAAGTLLLDTYKQKKQECDRRISEVQEQIEQSKVEESTKSVVPGTVRAAAEQAENFLNGTRLTASMVSAFIENVFVYDGGRIVVRFKYEQGIQDAVKALHTG